MLTREQSVQHTATAPVYPRVTCRFCCILPNNVNQHESFNITRVLQSLFCSYTSFFFFLPRFIQLWGSDCSHGDSEFKRELFNLFLE